MAESKAESADDSDRYGYGMKTGLSITKVVGKLCAASRRATDISSFCAR
jgi:hypothetical protein